MSKIPCEMIRDLFPSYIDGLTSEASNKEIEEHVAECEECQKLLQSMKGEEEAFAPEEPEKKEIDYLKKNKKRNLMIVLFSILGAVLLALLVIAIRFFVVGEDTGDLVPDVIVNGKDLTVKYTMPADSASAVKGIRFEEKDGEVTVTARKVLVSFFHQGNAEAHYTASKDIKRVIVGDRIRWEAGTKITFTGELWQTRHEYVGDMSANQRSARALMLFDVLGTYTNELQTTEEPYGWKIILKYDLSIWPEVRDEISMRGAAFLLMAVTGNLDRVTFSYTKDDVPGEITFTREEADTFFGRSIRDCMDSPSLLEELAQKTEWYHTLFHKVWIRNVAPPWWMEGGDAYK